MSRGPKLGVDKIAEINAMYSDGVSGACIAQALGVSIPTVFRRITADSVEKHKKATDVKVAVASNKVDVARQLAPLHKRIAELNRQKRLIDEELYSIMEALNAGVTAITSGFEEGGENDA